MATRGELGVVEGEAAIEKFFGIEATHSPGEYLFQFMFGYKLP
jgi:hypothetical protein